jgi:hypothetical protein
MARNEAAVRPIGAMDAFIAATAQAHGLTLVTRNVPDFEAAIKAIINPWNGIIIPPLPEQTQFSSMKSARPACPGLEPGPFQIRRLQPSPLRSLC